MKTLCRFTSTVGIFLLILSPCLSDSQTEKELKIGALLSLSGTGTTTGLPMLKVIEMQAEQVNKAGGVKIGKDKYLVKIISEDDKTSAAGGKTSFEKLVYKDEIRFMVGTPLGASAIAIAPLREEAKVLTMDISSTPEIWKPSGKYAFKAHVMINLCEPILFGYLVKNYPDVKRYAILGANDASGRAVYSGLQMGLKDLEAKQPGRIKVVHEAWFERGTTEFTPMLTSLLRTNPDVIDVCGANTTEATFIIKQARDLGYKKMFATTYALKMAMLREVCGEDYIYGIVMVGLDWENPPTPEAKKFVEDYRAKYKELPGGIEIYAVDQFPLLVRAIEMAGTIDSDKVVATMESWKNFPTLTGIATGWGGEKTFGWKRQIQRPWPLMDIKSATKSICVVGPAPTIP
jgi:branched-chain amino acid transport system substrate-binding protein